ncbi:unnamed protein product [Bursaphelenchus okinawaensis]|uniref:Major sperm protein n=1 Tax=Bursaphelenchus okinawaensis TaxID=465554 RepID=A0A811LQW6_9BILA|nr:unnamed protein product [Bursaphelenchus okinawaensis]CAG9127451.1 unnamed protein product [Bursaphelenchus okinawaensis]
MLSVMDEEFLQAIVPAALNGALMLGGMAYALAQCGKSRDQPKRKSKRSGKSGKSRKTGKSKKSSKSGKSSRSGKSDKSSKRGKKEKKSSKSSKSLKSSKSSRSGKSKEAGRKGKKSSCSKRIQRPSDVPKVGVQAVRDVAQSDAYKDESMKNVAPRESFIESARLITSDPHELRFPSTGGLKKLTLTNPNSYKVAFKIKCSDNNLYRVNPVYGFIPPNSEQAVDVVRQNGASKIDKMVFLLTKVAPDAEQPKKAFGNNEVVPLLVVPLLG